LAVQAEAKIKAAEDAKKQAEVEAIRQEITQKVNSHPMWGN
jgi:hypothetical protein